MTETTNSQAKKSSDGTSIPSKDSQELDATPSTEEVLKQLELYYHIKQLRPKHPHC